MNQNVSVRDLAKGRWRGILPYFGVGPQYLTGKHCPCPICGGKDRFRFDDKNGVGDWICSSCGSGDGVMLATQHTGLPVGKVIMRIKEVAGAVEATPVKERDTAKELHAIKSLWERAQRPADGGPVQAYLNARLGRPWRSNAIREVLDCWEAGSQTRMPAMVAAVTDPDGLLVNCHLTYLTPDGQKVTRRVMPGSLPEGCCIRLWEPRDGVLGIAEGIETAMAAAARFKVPTVSAINANRLAAWEPPAGVREVYVFGDNDESYTGQAAAYNLARKLVLKHSLIAHVTIPPETGTDWAD